MKGVFALWISILNPMVQMFKPVRFTGETITHLVT